MLKLSALNKMSKDEINALTKRILVRAIKLGNKQYHAKGQSVLTDDTYDRLKDALRARYPNHRLLKTVGAKVEKAAGRTKEKLPYPMFSLDKYKPGDEEALAKWAKHFPGRYIASDKMDGSSLEVVYEGRDLKSIHTRGDGTIGQNVTHLAKYLNVPAKVPMKKLAVRLELVMQESKFQKHGRAPQPGKKNGYQNPRNLVAGLANKVKGDHSLLKHADAVAYEIIFPRMKPSVALKKLTSMGFNVVKYTILSKLDTDSLSKLLIKRKKLSKMGLDGLVIEQDAVNTRPSAGAHSPEYAFAFKMTTDDDIALVEVTKVVWTASRHGKLKPQVYFKPYKGKL